MLAGGLVAATAGCQIGSERNRGGGGTRTVTAVTGFGMAGQDAYMAAAIGRGLFARQGLKVELKAGAGTVHNLQALAAGRAQFVTLDLSGAIQALVSKGTDFVAVAAVYQHSVSCVIAPASGGIARPADLAGKRIGFQPGGVNYTLFPTYAKLAGLDASRVRWRAVAPAQMRTQLVAGTVDAITETVIGKAGVQAVLGAPVVVLPYSDVLADLYGNVWATTRAIASTEPGLVRRFCTAAMDALAWAVEHPEQAGQYLASRVPAYRPAVAAAETALMRPYVIADGGAPVGSFDPARVARSIAILKGSGATTADPPPEQIVAFDLALTGPTPG